MRLRWLGFSLALVVATLGGMAFAVATGIPQAFYLRYKSDVRQALGLPKAWVKPPDAARAAGRPRVACPAPEEAVVIVTGGQSNAANTNPVPSTAGPVVSVWFEGECFEASDPVLGAGGKDGSLWPMLGERVAQALGRPVLLINGAIGGTQVSDWLDPRPGYYAALKGRIDSARAAGYPPDLIIWHQGETDAAVQDDMAIFLAELGMLVDRLLADAPEARLYLFQTSKCVGEKRDQGVEEIRMVQRAVAEKRAPRVIPGMDTDQLGNDFRWDTCHFNSHGRAAIIEATLPAITEVLALVD